jgi:ribosome biogenesis protein ERB1
MPISKKTKKPVTPKSGKSEETTVSEVKCDDLKSFDAVDDLSTEHFSSSDDSEDEVTLNRSGNVPKHWYEEEDHRGYDIYGSKVVKTLMSSKIDELLKNAENPESWRTVQDLQNEREVYLTDADIEIIRRLRAGYYPDGTMRDDDYYVEYDDTPHKIHPLRSKDLPKSRFLASKDESREITRLVKLIRAGKLLPRSRRGIAKPSEHELYDMWAPVDDDTVVVKGPSRMPAPKMPLPGHAESYHPPEEYLFSPEEKNEWLAGDDSTRKSTFIPESFPCLRRVPWYAAFITERFSRCLDLYTVPRMFKKKMNIDPESLLPKLPKLSDLRPFPTCVSVEYIGHEKPITSVSPSPTGEWLASTSTDGSVRVWDTITGKCIWVASEGPSRSVVSWHPSLPILAVGDMDGSVCFVFLNEMIDESRDESIAQKISDALSIPEGMESNWERSQDEKTTILKFSFGATTPITSLNWHNKGVFLAAVASASPSREKSCCVISIANKKHVSPLKGKGQTTGSAKHVVFHPTKPYLIVAGSSHVAVFDLKTQHKVKSLNPNSNTVSSIAVHPAGNGSHYIASSLDCKVIWFDSEVRDKPWKNLRHHGSAVRKVAIHPLAGDRLPLMASAGDDRAVHVIYSKVYENDETKNPMVVPVKKLGHPDRVVDCQWHPTLPWIFTACTDGIVRLWA